MSNFDNQWSRYAKHGESGYIFTEKKGLDIVVLPEHECTGRPKRIVSAKIKLQTSYMGVLLDEADFIPPDDENHESTNDEILACAKRFALLHAARYFQTQAEECLSIYQTLCPTEQTER